MMSIFCHNLDLKQKALVPWKQSETKVLLTPNISLSDLLDELLIEIFVRVPSKESIRCKSVCKRWYSLISLSILNHHHLVFRLHHWCINIEHCFPRQESRGFIDLSFLPFPKLEMRLLATSVDLMLCCQNNEDLSCSTNFYVVNLLTLQWIALPPAPPGLLVHSTATGFVLQSNTNRFRIVRIPDYDRKTPSSEIKIQVFSSEKGEWKWFNVSSPCMLKNYGLRRILVYKGLLHWLTGDGIFVYDPFSDPQRFSRFIDLPAGKFSYQDCYGVSQGGHLYVAQLTGRHDPDRIKNSSVSVWELEEDYNWCFRHKMYLRELSFIGTPLERFVSRIRSQNCHIRILAFHPADVNILYLAIGYHTVRCDMKKHALLDCIREDVYTLWTHSSLPLFGLVVNRSGPTPLPHFSELDMQE